MEEKERKKERKAFARSVNAGTERMSPGKFGQLPANSIPGQKIEFGPPDFSFL